MEELTLRLKDSSCCKEFSRKDYFPTQNHTARNTRRPSPFAAKTVFSPPAMKAFFAAVLLVTTLATAGAENPTVSGRQLSKKGGRRGKKTGGCADPMQAVLDLLECVAQQDVECAAAAYDPGFQRFHNEEFTGDIPGRLSLVFKRKRTRRKPKYICMYM